MMRRLLPVAAAAISVQGCGAEPQGSASNAGVAPLATADQEPSALEVMPLQIRSGSRTHSFQVEVARTPEEQAQGLMFRKSLAPDRGMLFPFIPPRPASFWMKNTLIPLDIIFIRPDGTIARIAVNTVPHSEQRVAVQEPMAAVLELAGGRSVQLGIKAGDRVAWSGGPPL